MEVNEIAREAAEASGFDWQKIPTYSRGRWEEVARAALGSGLGVDETPMAVAVAAAIARRRAVEAAAASPPETKTDAVGDASPTKEKKSKK